MKQRNMSQLVLTWYVITNYYHCAETAVHNILNWILGDCQISNFS